MKLPSLEDARAAGTESDETAATGDLLPDRLSNENQE
jgi:hypothetical protein